MANTRLADDDQALCVAVYARGGGGGFRIRCLSSLDLQSIAFPGSSQFITFRFSSCLPSLALSSTQTLFD